MSFPPYAVNVAPLGVWWFGSKEFHGNIRTTNITYYRNELDCQEMHQVIWEPYTGQRKRIIHPICIAGSAVWRFRTCLICYNMVVMNVPDRVMAQFGLCQHIPIEMDRIRHVDGRVRGVRCWATYHRGHLERWADRLNSIIEEHHLQDTPSQIRARYLRWYLRRTKKVIQVERLQPRVAYEPRGPVEREMLSNSFEMRRLLRIWVNQETNPVIREQMIKQLQVYDTMIEKNSMHDLEHHSEDESSGVPVEPEWLPQHDPEPEWFDDFGPTPTPFTHPLPEQIISTTQMQPPTQYFQPPPPYMEPSSQFM